MWEQWLIKSGRGTMIVSDQVRGPAPPAAVAAAAKIAFTTLGNDLQNIVFSEAHEVPISEAAPVDPSSITLLERTDSGTLQIPVFHESDSDVLDEWSIGSKPSAVRFLEYSTRLPVVRGSHESASRRNTNLHWLRDHFRSLSDIGRLPFNNADLWQLHQHYFSPPNEQKGDGEQMSLPVTEEGTCASSVGEATGLSPHTNGNDQILSRAVSFLSLQNAFAASLACGSMQHHKRPMTDSIEEEAGHAAKKAKNWRPRIANYPRIMVCTFVVFTAVMMALRCMSCKSLWVLFCTADMPSPFVFLQAKIESLGARPMDSVLSLLRQLKYIENIMFAESDPSPEAELAGTQTFRFADVEMILLDLM
jgi:hypothetical protein